MCWTASSSAQWAKRFLKGRRDPVQSPVLVELEDADKLPGAPAIAVPFPQPFQRRLVMGGPLGPPLPNRSGAFKRPHLPADQFQVVHRINPPVAMTEGSGMFGHLLLVRIKAHPVTANMGPETASHIRGRHRYRFESTCAVWYRLIRTPTTLVFSNGVSGSANSRSCSAACRSPIVRSSARPPIRRWSSEAFQQLRVQILQVGHLGNRHQEVPACETHQAFDTAFLLAPGRITEPRFKRVVGSKRREPVLLDPGLPSQNPLHSRLQVVEDHGREYAAVPAEPPD